MSKEKNHNGSRTHLPSPSKSQATSTEALPADDNSHLLLLWAWVHWSQEPHSRPIQALSHMCVPVQKSVPETGGSLRTEGGTGGQSSPSQCTVHGMKGADKVHWLWLLIPHYQQVKSCWVWRISSSSSYLPSISVNIYQLCTCIKKHHSKSCCLSCLNICSD